MNKKNRDNKYKIVAISALLSLILLVYFTCLGQKQHFSGGEEDERIQLKLYFEENGVPLVMPSHVNIESNALFVLYNNELVDENGNKIINLYEIPELKKMEMENWKDIITVYLYFLHVIHEKNIQLDDNVSKEEDIYKSNLDILKIENRTIDDQTYKQMYEIIKNLKTFDTNDTTKKKCVFSEFNKSHFFKFYYAFFNGISTDEDLVLFFDKYLPEYKHLIQYIFLIEKNKRENEWKEVEEFHSKVINIETNMKEQVEKQLEYKELSEWINKSSIPQGLFKIEGEFNELFLIPSWRTTDVHSNNIPIYNLYLMLRSSIKEMNENFSGRYDSQLFQGVKDLRHNPTLEELMKNINIKHEGEKTFVIDLKTIFDEDVKDFILSDPKKIKTLEIKISLWRDHYYPGKKLVFARDLSYYSDSDVSSSDSEYDN